MDFLFSPSSQPALSCILTNLNVLRLDVIRKSLIGAAAINADELITNANPLIIYISLNWVFFNLEGTSRIVYFNTTVPNIIYNTAAVSTNNTASLNVFAPLTFNAISFSVALANAGTTVSFIGYRVLTQ